MTDERMALLELVEKDADGHLVREILAFAAERVMEMEVEAATGAPKGTRSATRTTQRNGYRGFRSLSDPIDTTTPQGRVALQILGTVAEFERTLISERTKAGLARAAAEGRRGGSPGLKAGSPIAAAAISRARFKG
jgi:hypothetical protein